MSDIWYQWKVLSDIIISDIIMDSDFFRPIYRISNIKLSPLLFVTNLGLRAYLYVKDTDKDIWCHQISFVYLQYVLNKKKKCYLEYSFDMILILCTSY